MVENKQTMFMMSLFKFMSALSFKLKSGRMQLFSDPKLIALKTLREARGCHIVAVKTSKGEFTKGNIVAVLNILQKQ